MDQEKIIVLRQLVSNQLGLHFHENQWSSLERYLVSMARDLKIPDNFESLQAFLSKTSFTEFEFEALSKNLTIGETYFFREKVALHLFSDEILPRLINERTGNNQHIRIWSAGCSTGEEPYTLAMIIRDKIQDLHQWQIEILATDINLDALRRARAGIYPAWSFRETSADMKKKYFAENGRHHEIKSELKQMVSFAKLNLANDPFPSATNYTGNFDVIFCRNVLMYFLPSIAKTIAGGFHQSLKEGAWLITSQVELNDDYFSLFSRKMVGQGIFYQKTLPSPIHSNTSNEAESRKTPTPRTATKIKRVQPPKTSIREGLNNLFISNENIKEGLNNLVISNDRKQEKRNDSGEHPISSFKKTRQQEATFDIPNTMHAANLYAEARYKECAEWCEHFLKQHPFDKQIGYLLIQSLANSGKLKSAREWSERIISGEEANAELIYLYATILMEQNEWEQAELALIKTLYLDPEHPSASFYLASILKKAGKTKQALKYYNHLLHLLNELDDDDTVPAMESMTAGRLRHMVELNTKE